MQIKNSIRPEIISAAVNLLVPSVPELTPVGLVEALKNYKGSGITETILCKPLRRKEAANLLGVSLPTINRLLNRGVLRRIHVSRGAVRISHESVQHLLQNS